MRTETGTGGPAGLVAPERRFGAPRAISIRGVTKSFGANVILDSIDLEIHPGELLALLGPSGSGKTTLLRLMAGLETATAGAVLFDDEDATNLSVQERRVGFMFQSYALFRHMSVFDNVAYGLTVRPKSTRPPKREIADRVEALLDMMQLSGFGDRYPSQLSGGQRQRIALARALAIEPRVLLLDEPFGALDAKVRKELRKGLRDIHERTGLTTVFVTHDQAEAMEVADRVAILNAGRVEQIGPPRELAAAPRTDFVRAFLE